MIEVNGKKEKVVSPLIKKNKEYYVSLNDLSNYLDYSYTWNIECDGIRSFTGAGLSVFGGSYDIE